MTQARYLTAPSATKRTGFIDVEIPKSVAFEPGDAFGIVRPSHAWVTMFAGVACLVWALCACVPPVGDVLWHVVMCVPQSLALTCPQVCSNSAATVNSLLGLCAHNDPDASFTFGIPACEIGDEHDQPHAHTHKRTHII